MTCLQKSLHWEKTGYTIIGVMGYPQGGIHPCIVFRTHSFRFELEEIIKWHP